MLHFYFAFSSTNREEKTAVKALEPAAESHRAPSEQQSDEGLSTEGRAQGHWGAGTWGTSLWMHQAARWHHLRRGCWPLITSAINHQALLPNADGLGREKNVLSRPGLLSSNSACVENNALFPPCIWDVRNWSALWRGRYILEHCSHRKRGIHLWVVQEELLFSALWPFRIMVCPWPVGNLPSSRSIPNPTGAQLCSPAGPFLVRHCKHWDPAAPTEQITDWKTVWSLQQLLPSKAFCKVRVPETKILSFLVFCENFHHFTENPTQLCTPGRCPHPPPAAELLGQLSYKNTTKGKQSRVRTQRMKSLGHSLRDVV